MVFDDDIDSVDEIDSGEWSLFKTIFSGFETPLRPFFPFTVSWNDNLDSGDVDCDEDIRIFSAVDKFNNDDTASASDNVVFPDTFIMMI